LSVKKKMKITNGSEEFELECYQKILDYFQKGKVDNENTEIWKNQSLIEMMELLD